VTAYDLDDEWRVASVATQLARAPGRACCRGPTRW